MMTELKNRPENGTDRRSYYPSCAPVVRTRASLPPWLLFGFLAQSRLGGEQIHISFDGWFEHDLWWIGNGIDGRLETRGNNPQQWKHRDHGVADDQNTSDPFLPHDGSVTEKLIVSFTLLSALT